MIFWTWRSYFIRWQIFENKVWCPVSKKRTKYFHFLLSLAYPIDRLDWALFSVVILFHHLFPLLEKVEIRVFILPRNFPAVLIIFTGRGGEPPFPAGRGVHPWSVGHKAYTQWQFRRAAPEKVWLADYQICRTWANTCHPTRPSNPQLHGTLPTKRYYLLRAFPLRVVERGRLSLCVPHHHQDHNQRRGRYWSLY